MEIFLFFAGLIAGWLIQHIYSRRSASDQKQLFGKLSAEIRELILSDPRAQLSVRELNELIHSQTIDKEAEEGKIPLPYMACPKCGSKDIKREEAFDAQHDEMYYAVSCKECGWTDWTQ